VGVKNVVFGEKGLILVPEFLKGPKKKRIEFLPRKFL